MVAPTFRRPNDTAVDTGNVKYGAPDIVKVANVLDGSHATEKIQSYNLEGLEKLSHPRYRIRQNPSDSTIYEAINTATRQVEFSRQKSLFAIFRDIDAVMPSTGGGIYLTPSNTPYIAFGTGSTLGVTGQFTKPTAISGYGARIEVDASSRDTQYGDSFTGGFVNQMEDNSLWLYGLTINAAVPANDPTSTTRKIRVFLGGGSLDANRSPRLWFVKDCTMLNTKEYFIFVAAAKDDPTALAANSDSALIVDNCYFDVGKEPPIGANEPEQPAGPGETDECFEILGLRNVIIRNCRIYMAKLSIMAAKYAQIYNVHSAPTNPALGLASADTNKEGQGWGLQCGNVDIRNCTLVGQDINLRPYTSVHTHDIMGDMEYANIENCVFLPGPKNASYDPLSIQTIGNDDNGDFPFHFINISDVYMACARPKIKLEPTDTGAAGGGVGAGGKYAQIRGLVKMLNIENLYYEAFPTSSPAAIIHDNSVSIDYLNIKNFKCGASSWTDPTNEAAIRIIAETSNVNIGYLNVQNIDPLPTSWMVWASSPTFAAGSPPDTPTVGNFTATVNNVTMPLRKGINAIRITETATGSTIKFLNNFGKATFSGNGSTTAFNIAHGLSSSPVDNSIQITLGSSAASTAGPISVGAGATNITVTFASAPASGTNNVVLYWSASAA